MVYESNAFIIVMLTKFVEKSSVNKPKMHFFKKKKTNGKRKIVMNELVGLTVLKKKKKRETKIKCAFYFPDVVGETKEAGDFYVTLVDEFSDDHNICRTLQLKTQTENRVIYHFQSVDWPDYGIPSSSAGFLELVKFVNEKNQPNKPIIVHCSAGVGRSGTYCAIHSAITQIDNGAQTLNIPKTLIQMRKQR